MARLGMYVHLIQMSSFFGNVICYMCLCVLVCFPQRRHVCGSGALLTMYGSVFHRNMCVGL
jgi:hypothetical protein